MARQCVPFRRKHFDRSATFDISDHGLLDSNLGHGFKILSNAIGRDITIQPVPETIRLGRFRRIPEAGIQINRANGERGQQQGREYKRCASIHVSLFQWVHLWPVGPGFLTVGFHQ